MAKLPGVEDLGGLPTAAATRPVASYDVSAYARGAQAIAQGGKQLGQGIGEAGLGLADVAIDKGRWEYAQAHSDFLARKIDLDAATKQDTNYGPDENGQTLPQRYEASVKDLNTQSAALISDPRLRERFTYETRPLVERGIADTAAHARGLENNASVAYVQQQGDNIINKAVTAPDDDTRAQLISSHNQLVDGLVAKGAITPENAVTMKRTWAQQYATADYLAAINSNDPAKIEAAVNRLQAAPGSGDQITQRILQNEGTAKNPRSSATGAGNFIDSTWLDMIKRHRPDLAEGRSDQDILALRQDHKLGAEMTEAYRAENEAYLKKQGLPATPGQQYLAHFLGPGAAAAVLKADPNKPIADVLTAAVGDKKAAAMIAANQSVLGGQLAGSVTAWADRKMDGDHYDILHLDPVTRERLLAQGEAQLHKQTTDKISTFHNSVQDDVAEANRTGAVTKPKTQADFIGAYGAQHGPAQFAAYQADLQLGADKLRLSTMSPPEIDALIKSYEPQPGTEGYARAVKRVEDLEAAAQAEGVRRLSPSVKSDLAEAAREGTVKNPKTRADFDLAYGDKAKGGEAFAAYQEAIDTANEARSLPSATPGQVQGIIGSHAPVPGPDYVAQARRQDNLRKVAAGLAKERDDDPAQYGISHLPAVTESWGALVDTMNDATASPEVKRAMARDYATKTTMEQQRMGVAPDAIRIAPDAYIDRIKGQLSTAAASDDPQKRVALVGQIQREAAMWGDNWPTVMRQMADKRVEPIVRAIAAGADTAAMTRLLSLKPDATPKTILGEQNDTKLNQVTEKVNAAMAPFRDSLVDRQLTQDFPDYQDLAMKLTALYALRGKSADEAATQAFNELIGNRWDFRDTWRMPKSAGVSADDVQKGALAATAALAARGTSREGQVEPSMSGGPLANLKAPLDDMPGRGDALTDWRALAHDGKWVTSYDGAGLNLVTPGGNFARRADDPRQPFLLTWAQLADLGRKSDYVPASRGDEIGP